MKTFTTHQPKKDKNKHRDKHKNTVRRKKKERKCGCGGKQGSGEKGSHRQNIGPGGPGEKTSFFYVERGVRHK